MQPASVVQDVARSSAKDTGWLKYFWDCYLQQDIFRDLNQNDKLVQLHSHAEQYDASTETLFHALTVRHKWAAW